MKTVVFAYHNIGCIGLKALLENNFEVSAVFTYIDNENENIWFDSVAELAAEHNIPVYTPENVNNNIWISRIKNMNPDYIFSFYYRNLLSKEILDIPSIGSFNLHGSLLPKYRGRAPINWVLVNGEKETGVTLHHMTEKPDDGDIVASKKVEIDKNDTALTLNKKMSNASFELLKETLPLIKTGKAKRIPQDPKQATYFGKRTPKDGLINWKNSAEVINNLIKAVTKPYPGAFTFLGDKKIIIWEAIESNSNSDNEPGTVISVNPLKIQCKNSTLTVKKGQLSNGVTLSGNQLASEAGIVPKMKLGATIVKVAEKRKKSVLILGVNGFIGNALSQRLLKSGDYEVYGMDLRSNNIEELLNEKDFHFREGDISIHREWIEYHVKKCDIILPLVAIATPIEYTRNPLKVFELDFEENLKIIRYCVKYNKRVIFPSTSEVYGMCPEPEFDENNSVLVTGPIRMQRWIYSNSKQLLDRVIWAYGQRDNLQFTLFRPFNWIGPKLDSLESARIGSSRAITQLILNLVQGTPIQLVDGGEQQRCFTDVSDGIECLFRIIDNKDKNCNSQIFNIGNPENEYSIKELAETLVEEFEKHPLRNMFPPFAGYKIVLSNNYYGKGYQDIQKRKPSIKNAQKLLNWEPKISFNESVKNTLDFFLNSIKSFQ